MTCYPLEKWQYCEIIIDVLIELKVTNQPLEVQVDSLDQNLYLFYSALEVKLVLPLYFHACLVNKWKILHWKIHTLGPFKKGILGLLNFSKNLAISPYFFKDGAVVHAFPKSKVPCVSLCPIFIRESR